MEMIEQRRPVDDAQVEEFLGRATGDVAGAMVTAFCALGEGATSPITSSLKYFRGEYEDYITGRIPPRLRQTELVGAH